nr:translation initiation factor IF-2-like [Aegilops tauschii subsp. strangulata]
MHASAAAPTELLLLARLAIALAAADSCPASNPPAAAPSAVAPRPAPRLLLLRPQLHAAAPQRCCCHRRPAPASARRPLAPSPSLCSAAPARAARRKPLPCPPHLLRHATPRALPRPALLPPSPAAEVPAAPALASGGLGCERPHPCAR